MVVRVIYDEDDFVASDEEGADPPVAPDGGAETDAPATKDAKADEGKAPPHADGLGSVANAPSSAMTKTDPDGATKSAVESLTDVTATAVTASATVVVMPTAVLAH